MSGGNCPETPRQKMIGMMYLFYTALLALNVSAEVIEAFVKVDTSINQTTTNFSSKTQSLYAKIDASYNENKNKYGELKEQSNYIEKQCNELFAFVDSLKIEILKAAGETPEASEEAALISESDGKIKINSEGIKKKDNLEAAHTIMGNESGQGDGGNKLRLKIEGFRNYLLETILKNDTTQSVYKNIATCLETYEGIQETKDGPRTWGQKFYQAMPLIGTIALLSKLQADIRNVEADILESMISTLEGMDIRITSLEGLVSAPKSFVLRGEEYTSKIFLGALDSTMRPIVHITTSKPFWDTKYDETTKDTIYVLRSDIKYDTIVADETGKANYTVSCGSVGDFEYGGLVLYKSNKGDKWMPFTGAYQVGEAGYTVSATKCNVFYKGLENPVAVSVAGYPKESVHVGISAGSITPAAGGGYIVRIPAETTAKEVSVSVSADGKALGSVQFKVFDVPPPTIMVAGTYKDGATMPKAAIMQNPYLFAGLGTGFFPFDGIKYSVSRYDFMYSVRGVATRNTYQGAQIPADVLSIIRGMGSKSQVSFTNIYYTGPSGTKTTNGVTVILQ